MMFVMKTID